MWDSCRHCGEPCAMAVMALCQRCRTSPSIIETYEYGEAFSEEWEIHLMLLADRAAQQLPVGAYTHIRPDAPLQNMKTVRRRAARYNKKRRPPDAVARPAKERYRPVGNANGWAPAARNVPTLVQAGSSTEVMTLEPCLSKILRGSRLRLR